MNGKDMMKCILENQEFDAKRSADLDYMYYERMDKLMSEKENERKSQCFDMPSISKNPFIHVTNKAPEYVENQITLTDNQFKQLLEVIERRLK